MAFLEAHHRSEDLGLYPVVARRRPGAGPLLDDMARDHRAVAAAMVGLRAASATYAEHDDGQPVVDAIDHLIDVLDPHLSREEDEVMPVVSQAMPTRSGRRSSRSTTWTASRWRNSAVRGTG